VSEMVHCRNDLPRDLDEDEVAQLVW
jgi:hypothetical protein